MREYQTYFEKLANHIEGLDEVFSHSCFISRIKEEIQVEVKMFNPNNMIAMIGLAKLAEDKLSEKCKNTKQTTWKSQIFQSGHKPP